MLAIIEKDNKKVFIDCGLSTADLMRLFEKEVSCPFKATFNVPYQSIVGLKEWKVKLYYNQSKGCMEATYEKCPLC